MSDWFKRDAYLQPLVAGRGNGLVKIITGLRRCGKSFLLFKLFREHLRSAGVADDHVIEVAFDDLRMEAMRDPHRFLRYVAQRMGDGFRRVIVVGDDLHHYHDDQGVLVLGILDFLLHPDSLDW